MIKGKKDAIILIDKNLANIIHRVNSSLKTVAHAWCVIYLMQMNPHPNMKRIHYSINIVSRYCS